MPDKKKIRYGGTSAIEKMEEAAGIGSTPLVPNTGTATMPSVVPEPPASEPKIFEPGKRYPISDIMEKQSSLRRRSVMGSKSFSDAELKQGYRKIK